jgi:Holliday junction resolvase RusA-like endonuclease
MITLKIKALSLNQAYRGRRFTTPLLKQFKEAVYFLSPKLKIPEGKLKVKYEFGVSSKNSDGDNLIKCLQDSLADKYGFNDKKIYQWEVEKIDVKKGEEYIKFEITSKA